MKYEESTFAPFFSKSEMASMSRMLSLDLPGFKFDPAYIFHIEKYNGGKPKDKYFKTQSGKCLPIDRFLNYSDTKLLADRSLQRLNANVAWSLIEHRLSIYLLPFAVLPDGDYLCFDYENGFPPSVVLWRHELSEENAPYTEAVSENFEKFVQSLIFKKGP